VERKEKDSASSLWKIEQHEKRVPETILPRGGLKKQRKTDPPKDTGKAKKKTKRCPKEF